MFQIKSKSQREQEEKDYAVWAFPYGDMQKEKLTALIKELLPKTHAQIGLVAFLTCKEIFEKTLENSESREAAVYKTINDTNSYSQLIKSKEMPTYLALVLADADIDENCEYSSVDELRDSIQKISEMRSIKKRSLFQRK